MASCFMCYRFTASMEEGEGEDVAQTEEDEEKKEVEQEAAVYST